MNRMNCSRGYCPPPGNGCQTDSHFLSLSENKNQSRTLFKVITEEGFAAYETLLYLDTHPADQDALDYFYFHTQRYQAAVKEYEHLYGPLTLRMDSASKAESWTWMQQPWPWEGGNC